MYRTPPDLGTWRVTTAGRYGPEPFSASPAIDTAASTARTPGCTGAAGGKNVRAISIKPKLIRLLNRIRGVRAPSRRCSGQRQLTLRRSP